MKILFQQSHDPLTHIFDIYIFSFFFFYTSNLQGLAIQQYKNKKNLKYKYKTRLKPWGNLIRFSAGSVHVENAET